MWCTRLLLELELEPGSQIQRRHHVQMHWAPPGKAYPLIPFIHWRCGEEVCMLLATQTQIQLVAWLQLARGSGSEWKRGLCFGSRRSGRQPHIEHHRPCRYRLSCSHCQQSCADRIGTLPPAGSKPLISVACLSARRCMENPPRAFRNCIEKTRLSGKVDRLRIDLSACHLGQSWTLCNGESPGASMCDA